MSTPTATELEQRLREIGEQRYHNNHPFHKLMRDGGLSKGQVQAWALNRYYYQSRIPIKDAALMSRIVDPELRRVWSQRVVDHDGTREGQGGISKWLHLCDRLGLPSDYVLCEEGVLPATRFAVASRSSISNNQTRALPSESTVNSRRPRAQNDTVLTLLLCPDNKTLGLS